MKIVYLANNFTGFKILEWLKKQGEQVVALFIHPPEKQKFAEEIIKIANVPSQNIFYGTELSQISVLNAISNLNPDIAISILFDYLLKKEFINLFPKGAVNLHPSYLPFNRGQYPNVWSIIEETPAGVTLHYIDEKVDTGDIIAQIEVPVEPIDTGETLYRKLEYASIDLFKKTWPLLKSGNAPRLKQDINAGTYHKTKDVEKIDNIELDRKYTAKELINIIRARTFPPYRGAYFKINGRKIYIRVELEYGDD